MRARVGEARERGVGRVREVDRARHDDGRRTVLEQVELRGEAALDNGRVTQEVVDRPRDAVTLRLAGDEHGVVGEQPLDQPAVPASQRVAEMVLEHLRTECRIVLGEGVSALDLELGRVAASDSVEEDRLLDRAHERMPDSADESMKRPDGQLVLPPGGECTDVRAQMFLHVPGVEPQRLGHNGIDTPDPALDVCGETSVYGSGCCPSASTRNVLWKIWKGVCVSSVATTCVSAPRFR